MPCVSGFSQTKGVAKFYQPTNYTNGQKDFEGDKMHSSNAGQVNFNSEEYDNWAKQNKYITIVYYRYKDYQNGKTTGDTVLDEYMNRNKCDVLVYYVDGSRYGYTGYSSEYYDAGFEKWGGDDVPLFIGVCPWNGLSYLYYLQGDVYTVRLYTRPLNSGEVKLNYDTTLEYREKLTK